MAGKKINDPLFTRFDMAVRNHGKALKYLRKHNPPGNNPYYSLLHKSYRECAEVLREMNNDARMEWIRFQCYKVLRDSGLILRVKRQPNSMMVVL